MPDDAGKWVTVEDPKLAKRWRARVKFRDHDGRLRDIERYAPTKGKAETAIKTALRDRTTPRSTDELRPDMRFGDAGKVWRRQLERGDSGLAANTVEQYLRGWDRYVEGAAFADFTLAEANRVPRVRAFLQQVADARGSGSAKTAKTVVSLVLGMAVTDGLFEVNAVRQLKGAPKRAVAVETEPSDRDRALLDAGWKAEDIRPNHERALTAKERADLVAKVRADEQESATARRADVADLVAFMAGVGPRIDEALRVRWEGVDFAKSTVWIPGTKTETSDRTLSASEWVLDVLRERHRLEGQPSHGFVFHAPAKALEDQRDRRNATRALRRVFDAAGYPWAIPHTLRRTVATLLDERGVPLAQIADYLGHADPSMTAREYLGRKVDTSRAAAAL